jgi:peptidoglycan/LPS O-acetylase OafA/YrhL
MRAADEPHAGHGIAPLPQSAARRPELLVLTSLRAFAALEVVLLHSLFELGGSWVNRLPAPIARVLLQGQVAVSFFFVLSGFILAYTYCEPAGGLIDTPQRFWRARFARVYPLYCLAFLVDLPRGIQSFLDAAPSVKSALGKIAVSGASYLTLTQSWYPRVTNSWNTPGWSLSAEAFFYAVFPALVIATKRWSVWRLLALAVVCWALPALGYEGLSHFRGHDLESANLQTFWRSFPPLRLPEFLLGVAAGRIYVSGQVSCIAKWLRPAGLVALALIAVLLGADLGLPQALVENTLEAPLFAIVILAAATSAIPSPWWLTSRPLLLLGRSSYAVYIVHQPFKFWFESLATRLGLYSPSPLLLVCYLCTLQTCCIGLFVWFEDPLRRAITARAKQSVARTTR